MRQRSETLSFFFFFWWFLWWLWSTPKKGEACPHTGKQQMGQVCCPPSFSRQKEEEESSRSLWVSWSCLPFGVSFFGKDDDNHDDDEERDATKLNATGIAYCVVLQQEGCECIPLDCVSLSVSPSHVLSVVVVVSLSWIPFPSVCPDCGFLVLCTSKPPSCGPPASDVPCSLEHAVALWKRPSGCG